MAATFSLDIVTPERTVLAETVSAVQLPSVDGSLGILANHAPLLAELGVGECVVKLPNGAEEQLVVSGGFVEVNGKKVTVLADTAEFSHEIDTNRAEEAINRARALLAGANALSDSEREEANITMRRAQAQIRIAGRQ